MRHTSSQKNELFGFAQKSVAQMLELLEQQCLALTAQDKKTKMKDVNIPWDCNDGIETYFVKANKMEEYFQENYGIECSPSMKITKAEDEMYRSNMFTKEEISTREEKPMADKTWVHLRTYFKDRWTATMQYQGHTPNKHSFDISTSAEEYSGKHRLAKTPRGGGSGNGLQGTHPADDHTERRPIEGCQKKTSTDRQAADIYLWTAETKRSTNQQDW